MINRLDEFSRISTFFSPLTQGREGTYNLQDDAATIAPAEGCELVITTDTIVETVHFIGHESAADIAAKLIGVNFSDLAGKGAKPLAYSLNLSLPSEIDDIWLSDFCEELGDLQKQYDCYLLGGDSVCLPANAPITLSITAFGEVPVGKMLRRNKARAGDLVCVSGSIGDGALGLVAAKGGLGIGEGADFLKRRYYRPVPRVELGQGLLGVATASMDISDGLIADLTHMIKASNVGASLNLKDVPLSSATVDILAEDPSLLENIMTGGDDYELLFTIASTDVNRLEGLAKESQTTLSVIGEITDSDSVVALDRDGKEITFQKSGFRHA